MIRHLLTAGLILLTGYHALAQIKNGNPEITEYELRQHIRFLASDELAGRYPGTNGDKKAAEYIRKKFKDYGLKLLGDKGFQPFEVITRVFAGKKNSLVSGQFRGTPMTDFTPLGFSGKTRATAGAVFAGYGFQMRSDSFQWDDYKGINPKGKWCIILRGYPEIIKASDKFRAGSQDRDKAMLAKDLGAAGVLLVSGIEYDKNDELTALSFKEGSLDIPVFQVKRTVSDELLKSSNFTIVTLEEKIKKESSPFSFEINKTIEASADVEPQIAHTQNVIAMLEGNDPQLKKEYLVIGAHFDHLGMGGMGSGSRVPDTLGVHHGADDNASGVSAVIELAEKFTAHKDSLKRSIIFTCFSAEEEGILGSKYFTEHPVVDLKQLDGMINLDMIGRLKENRSLQITGTGTSAEATGILNSLNKDSLFHLNLAPEGYGPSDHTAFYAKDIPVLFFTTGAHIDYHTPRDNYAGINFAGLKQVADFVYILAMDLDREPNRLTYKEAGPKTQESSQQRFKVTLGIMPDFTSTDNKGLRADFVHPGKPAFKAGMLKGDIIVSMNGKPVNNIQDYMYRLSKLNHGETVNVEVIRNGKKELLIVQL